MEVSREDAGQSLEDISRVETSARRVALYKGPDALYMVWGAVWIVGFTLQHFFTGRHRHFGPVQIPADCFVWWPLVLVGIIATFALFRRRVAVRSEGGWRVGALWGVMFAYFYLNMFLILPLVDQHALQSPEGMRRFTAGIAIVPMVVYILMGLMGTGNYMIWLGSAVIAATIAGLLAVPSFFYLWMAALGGGALLVTGLVTRRRWAKS